MSQNKKGSKKSSKKGSKKGSKKITTNNTKKKTFVMFSQKERDSIMKDYNEITQGDKKYSKYPLSKLSNATKGMYIRTEIPTKKRSEKSIKDELDESIEKSYSEENDPIIHEDSMTAWGNKAAEQFGLEIKDIIKMKPGEKLDVLLMDRNVGDYMHGKKAGTKYDPKKKGLSYATYIHGEDLSGILIFRDMDVVHPCFTWEINETPYGGTFWNVISCKTNISKLNPRTKVGWRGPAITLENAKKYMPKTVTHYGTWWDDLLVWRYMDFLNKK